MARRLSLLLRIYVPVFIRGGTCEVIQLMSHPTPRSCPRCGYSLMGSERYCPNCATPIDERIRRKQATRTSVIGSLMFLGVVIMIASWAFSVASWYPFASSYPTHTRTPRPWTPTATTAYRSITWMELAAFISDDHTNWNEYDEQSYVCLDYAIDLVENAQRADIKAWIVIVEFSESPVGHAFVAFDTSDEGIAFIEPQTDNPYWNMERGKPLCDSWGIYECMGTVSSVEYVTCTHSNECQSFIP